MKLDFPMMEESILLAFRGGTGDTCAKMFVDEKNRLMYVRLLPGASIGVHTHDTSSEIIFILSGTGTAVCQGEVEHLAPGQCHYCKKGETHSLFNPGEEDLVFFAVVPQQ